MYILYKVLGFEPATFRSHNHNFSSIFRFPKPTKRFVKCHLNSFSFRYSISLYFSMSSLSFSLSFFFLDFQNIFSLFLYSAYVLTSFYFTLFALLKYCPLSFFLSFLRLVSSLSFVQFFVLRCPLDFYPVFLRWASVSFVVVFSIKR